MPPAAETGREIIVWVPPQERPEYKQAAAEKAKTTEMRHAETDARLATAKAREAHARMITLGRDLVSLQLEKLLRLAKEPDFTNCVGPEVPAGLIKLAELVSKDYRLDTGQATENIAHQVKATIDFASFTQEERDKWRELAIKGGASEDE